MKYHAVNMDLHKANKEASEGAMLLNIARGLVEAAKSVETNGSDAKQIATLKQTALEHVETAERQMYNAASLLTSIRNRMVFED